MTIFELTYPWGSLSLLQKMKAGGNLKSNAHFNGDERRNPYALLPFLSTSSS